MLAKFSHLRCGLSFIALLSSNSCIVNDITLNSQEPRFARAPKNNAAPAGEQSARLSPPPAAVREAMPFPIVRNKYVDTWIRYFQNRGKRTMAIWVKRGRSIKPVIEEILREEGLPPELYFLAVVESDLRLTARSRARAVGPWQFMSGTARMYGLAVNDWVDERCDPVKSTHAASAYLRDLRGQFDDWYLALAAYNTGPSAVRSAIRRSGSRNFWTLAKRRYLSRETRNHVPKILAAIILSRRLPGPKAPSTSFPSATVRLTRPIYLDEIARKIGVSTDKLRLWNPELVRELTPPVTKLKEGHYSLRLPSSKVEKFFKVEKYLTRLRVRDVKLHRVRPGDTIYGLARKYGVSWRRILGLNPRIDPRRLKLGSKLVVPVIDVTTAS